MSWEFERTFLVKNPGIYRVNSRARGAMTEESLVRAGITYILLPKQEGDLL